MLTLQYDGSAFHGWQAQPDVPTVQATLDRILSRLFDRPTRCAAAGRTDRGVHATGQVATVDAPTGWSPEQLLRALNALLPDEILVSSAHEVAPDVHARFSALARAYVYRVGVAERTRSPFIGPYCWPVCAPLDRAALDGAAATVAGEHSFAAFAKAGQEERGVRCRVFSSGWRDWGELGVAYHVRADRFLHHMVRYLVGTMIEVALGKRPGADIPGLLDAHAGLVTSAPAPAGGLFLARVYYDPDELERHAAAGAEVGLPIP